MLHQGQETDYPRAKRRAARAIGLRFRPDHLPSNREVRDQLRRIEEVVAMESPAPDARRLRIESYRFMRQFRESEPRVLFTGNSVDEPRQATIWLISSNPADSETKILTDRLHFHRQDLTVSDSLAWGAYASETTPVCVHVFEGGTFGGAKLPADAWNLTMLETELLAGGNRETFEDEIEGIDPRVDRFDVYRLLLESLEDVRLDRRSHPEGDALHHSLQVFELAVQESPFDEDFLAAALLHDVGKGVRDEVDHVAAGISLLAGVTTYRTRWLIAHLEDAKLLQRRELPTDIRGELEHSEDFGDLMRLADFDRLGRQPGFPCRELSDAIDYLRHLAVCDFED